MGDYQSVPAHGPCLTDLELTSFVDANNDDTSDLEVAVLQYVLTLQTQKQISKLKVEYREADHALADSSARIRLHTAEFKLRQQRQDFVTTVYGYLTRQFPLQNLKDCDKAILWDSVRSLRLGWGETNQWWNTNAVVCPKQWTNQRGAVLPHWVHPQDRAVGFYRMLANGLVAPGDAVSGGTPPGPGTVQSGPSGS